MGLLSVAIWLPIAFGAVLLAFGRDSNLGATRWLALIGAVLSFLVTLPLISGFDPGTAAMQFQENLSWIERFNVRYHLGVDGISVALVLLTTFTSVLVIVLGWGSIDTRVSQYMAAMLVLPAWGAIGIVIYFAYGMHRSHLGKGIVEVTPRAENEPLTPGV